MITFSSALWAISSLWGCKKVANSVFLLYNEVDSKERMIILKIKPGYIVKKVMNSYMLVSTEGESTTMQTMNETGAFLWSLLEGDTTVEEMTEKMVAEYEIDRNTAKGDIEAFIKKLQASDLLDQ